MYTEVCRCNPDVVIVDLESIERPANVYPCMNIAIPGSPVLVSLDEKPMAPLEAIELDLKSFCDFIGLEESYFRDFNSLDLIKVLVKFGDRNEVIHETFHELEDLLSLPVNFFQSLLTEDPEMYFSFLYVVLNIAKREEALIAIPYIGMARIV